MTYEIKSNIKIQYAAEVSRGEIEFSADSDRCWASYSLEADGKIIAESVSYESLRIDDMDACREYAATIDDDVDVDTDDSEIERIVEEALSGADELFEDNDGDAKESALAEMLSGPDSEWTGYRTDGRFANEYTLYLVAKGKTQQDAVELSAEAFASAWGRYPDAITESYVSVEVVA